MNSKPNPVETARRFVREKHPEAELAYVAGSIVRGEATAFSDIDLVIVYPYVEFPYRESFDYDEWPIETFVHDPATVNYFFHKVDGQAGDISLPSMVLEGQLIPEGHTLGLALKEDARKFIAKGPEAWSDDSIRNSRYMITDLIDDIRGYRNNLELYAVLGTLHESLANFYFRANRNWSASRKHIPRRLEKSDPAFAAKWKTAFERAYLGNVDLVISLAEEVLLPFGGFFFDGYRREAPKDWRLERNPS